MAKDEKSKQDKPEKKPAPHKQQQQKQPKKAAAPKKEAPPAKKETAPELPAPPARLAGYYKDKVVPELMQKFGYKTVMQVPRLRKITLNMGVGETTTDKKILDNALSDMTKIAGQKPVVTKARRSIANFKVRAGFPVSCMVTLRGARMYEFFDRLVNIAMPRIRDFRGVSNRAFDGQLQGPRRLSGRLHGDAARRAHVRVLRPAGEHRHAAHPRLPRRIEPRLRRPGQLQPRLQGADHLPGDRLRQDRHPP